MTEYVHSIISGPIMTWRLQIVWANGTSFDDITAAEAVRILRTPVTGTIEMRIAPPPSLTFTEYTIDKASGAAYSRALNSYARVPRGVWV